MPEPKGDETFTVSLVGPGIDVKREISANKVPLVLGVLMGSELHNAADTKQDSGSIKSQARVKISLREFLDDVKAMTKPDQIVAIGHYMSIHEGKETFSREDIKARFQSARERLPSNFPRDFNAAIGKAMIAEDHATSGQFYITKTGDQAIQRRFGSQN